MPRGLGYQGQKIWRAVVAEYDIDRDPDKQRIIYDIAKLADQIDELEKGMAGSPLTVKGSANQIVIHPLIAELRASRALMSNLFARLRFTDED
ncbi:hypothetical protein BH11ACT6_BH11ACT6_29870 [soil metagenome]